MTRGSGAIVPPTSAGRGRRVIQPRRRAVWLGGAHWKMCACPPQRCHFRAGTLQSLAIAPETCTELATLAQLLTAKTGEDWSAHSPAVADRRNVCSLQPGEKCRAANSGRTTEKYERVDGALRHRLPGKEATHQEYVV